MTIPNIKIFVITYRRPVLLKRALISLMQQSYPHWVAEVLNDDPADSSVISLINEINDKRISLSEPAVKRGGTGNFNYAFDHTINETFACILEDDNWYEADFLHDMLSALNSHPEVKMAVANEKIWKEDINNNWMDTGQTIWPIKKENEFFPFRMVDKCGTAKICNSSMFWRTTGAKWLTPAEIPIDVTEHFRERVIPHPILLVKKPLVNFSETLQTSRTYKSNAWSVYQALLIASVFEGIALDERIVLAEKLWEKARKDDKLFKTALFNAAWVSKAPFILFKKATIGEKIRYALTLIKNPKLITDCAGATKKHHSSWQFLLNHLNA